MEPLGSVYRKYVLLGVELATVVTMWNCHTMARHAPLGIALTRTREPVRYGT